MVDGGTWLRDFDAMAGTGVNEYLWVGMARAVGMALQYEAVQYAGWWSLESTHSSPLCW
ncbi:uncharacterized protein M421DRAFT_425568 [Didymella exigua CBS 183.55]|uniref:Uncharacterized protein n=1 Tax=Didymella exigua CBS 183.55 TaxID=1150837 RepID=A0A6A5R697_9PLEO|nr:uncharacterized protein M421DRAFT_425568 [Didymella exigua CBS 183.55]KAF1923671.1 hypothetical protein M421DRAFT_425568 [Didymella exigua CBS 183.55]